MRDNRFRTSVYMPRPLRDTSNLKSRPNLMPDSSWAVQVSIVSLAKSVTRWELKRIAQTKNVNVTSEVSANWRVSVNSNLLRIWNNPLIALKERSRICPSGLTRKFHICFSTELINPLQYSISFLNWSYFTWPPIKAFIDDMLGTAINMKRKAAALYTSIFLK